MNLNFASNILLEDKRVRLEPLTWAHFQPLLPIALKYPNLLRYSPSAFGTQTALKTYFQTAFDQRTQEFRYPFAIYDCATQQYAGSTSYRAVSNKDRRLEIGSTWIGKTFQRTGLNRHTKFLLLQYAFDTLDFERVELKTDSRNSQSRRAIEGIGGILEGTLRSHMLMIDGFRRDTVYYSILKTEWPIIKKDIFGQKI